VDKFINLWKSHTLCTVIQTVRPSTLTMKTVFTRIPSRNDHCSLDHRTPNYHEQVVWAGSEHGKNCLFKLMYKQPHPGQLSNYPGLSRLKFGFV